MNAYRARESANRSLRSVRSPDNAKPIAVALVSGLVLIAARRSDILQIISERPTTKNTLFCIKYNFFIIMFIIYYYCVFTLFVAQVLFLARLPDIPQHVEQAQIVGLQGGA